MIQAIYVTENPNATYNDERISRIVFTPDAELVWQPEGYEAVRATNPKLAAQILANSERVKAGMKPFPLEEIENLIQDVNYLKHYLGHLYANLEALEES